MGSSVITFERVVFLFGFVFGAGLGVIFFSTESHLSKRHNSTPFIEPPPTRSFYSNWISSRNLTRHRLSEDDVSYGNITQQVLREDAFLYKEIHITCVIFLKNRKSAAMVKSTYGNQKHCNDVLFVSSFEDNDLPTIVLKSKSSWHHLCQTIEIVWKTRKESLQWVFFVHDQLFAIPENLRYYIAETDYQYTDKYYLGNPMSFWGQTYNGGQSGYVLSRATVEAFDVLFTTTGGKTCSTGFNWRNEDFYLGKQLAEMGIFTTDTRDRLGRSRFHGYSLDRLLSIGGISPLDNYRKKGVYKVQEGLSCCSENIITFRAAYPSDLFFSAYLVYSVRVFRSGGRIGNQPYPVPEGDVWQEYLERMKRENTTIVPEEFENMRSGRPKIFEYD